MAVELLSGRRKKDDAAHALAVQTNERGVRSAGARMRSRQFPRAEGRGELGEARQAEPASGAS
jgi:hypothetical protein